MKDNPINNRVIEQYDKVRAIFRPKRLDDLQPDAKEYVGKEGVFQAMYINNTEDNPYFGQMTMLNYDWKMGWTPLCDLEVLEIL